MSDTDYSKMKLEELCKVVSDPENYNIASCKELHKRKHPLYLAILHGVSYQTWLESEGKKAKEEASKDYWAEIEEIGEHLASKFNNKDPQVQEKHIYQLEVNKERWVCTKDKHLPTYVLPEIAKVGDWVWLECIDDSWEESPFYVDNPKGWDSLEVNVNRSLGFKYTESGEWRYCSDEKETKAPPVEKHTDPLLQKFIDHCGADLIGIESEEERAERDEFWENFPEPTNPQPLTKKTPCDFPLGSFHCREIDSICEQALAEMADVDIAELEARVLASDIIPIYWIDYMDKNTVQCPTTGQTLDQNTLLPAEEVVDFSNIKIWE